QIGDIGTKDLAASLPALKSLTTLGLVDIQIGDIGAKDLAASLPALVNLKDLYLDNNRFGDIGAKVLAASLPALVKLEGLFLGRNRIGDIGATALAASMSVLPCLRTLDLSSNRLGELGARTMVRAVLRCPMRAKGARVTSDSDSPQLSDYLRRVRQWIAVDFKVRVWSLVALCVTLANEGDARDKMRFLRARDSDHAIRQRIADMLWRPPSFYHSVQLDGEVEETLAKTTPRTAPSSRAM
ncbi:MAG: hypothetical protein OK454_08660, partial [Thaumarchaeota archaeon]|nr:hypothetical protein [Nitrososphaerota archaeon]